MPSLDNLPADQRAVLQLVLQRGRTYDDIATLLSIDRGAVRQRARAALDALGPDTGVAPERRALITDYLLGQLPPQVAETTREHMAQSPPERAWARVVASELAPIASAPLPEISADASGRDTGTPEPAPGGAPEPAPGPASGPAPGPGSRTGRSSRRGGAVLLGLGGLAVVAAVVIVIVLVSGGSNKHSSSTTSTGAAASTTPTTTATSTTPTRVVGRVNLLPPGGGTSGAKGVAAVVKQGNNQDIAIVAEGVAPNTKHDAYAVWLYNSQTDAELLGFVNPGVGSNGRFSAARQLPTNAARFKDMVVTLETQAQPRQPGRIVLQGQLSGVS